MIKLSAKCKTNVRKLYIVKIIFYFLPCVFSGNVEGGGGGGGGGELNTGKSLGDFGGI